MHKILILHDLDPEAVAASVSKSERDGTQYTVFAQSPQVRPCVGCFGCWIKTPGRCVMADHDSELALLLPRADELTIISRLVFGGLSPNVKAVLDRSIGYVLPFFRYVDGEMHHAPRYANRLSLRYLFYGEDMPEAEKETARQLIQANTINLHAEKSHIGFFGSPEEALEALQ